MKITVNSHSSIRVEGKKVLWFDPFQLKTEPHDADIIFLTHNHYDHYSPEDIRKVAKDSTIFVVPKTLADEFPQEKMLFLSPGEKTTLPGISVTAVSAYNPNKPFHPRAEGWLGYLVNVDGELLYVCGDTDATPEAMAVKCDVLALPVGGTYTMDAAQAAKLAKTIRPKLAIPTHYGSVVGKKADAERFRDLVKGAMQVELLVEDAN